MTACYEPPEVTIVLSKEEIHKRYQDTAMIIFKVKKRSNKLKRNKFLIKNFLYCRRNKAERRKLSATLVLEIVAEQWNIVTMEISLLLYVNLQSLRLHRMLIYLRGCR